MKTFTRLTLIGCFALCGSGAALASGDCGMNSNKPCPPPEKSSSKEPAYARTNSHEPAARRTDASSAATDVQAAEGGDAEAKATLSGVSASDLKMPPAGDCGMNSNAPCADEGEAAEATLSGADSSNLKRAPKPTKRQRKDPDE